MIDPRSPKDGLSNNNFLFFRGNHSNFFTPSVGTVVMKKGCCLSSGSVDALVLASCLLLLV